MIVLNNGYVELIDSMGDDLRIVNAARKSFGKKSQTFGISEKKLLEYLWKNNHTSPFEMVEFTFNVKAPLFVIRQWHRHRTWSYNEVSRRYTSGGLDFHFPDSWRFQSEDNKQSSHGEFEDNLLINNVFSRSIEQAFTTYNFMVDQGVCREQARMVLPQNMMVEMVAKVDLSNLIKFLKLRNHEHAQWEIRQYAIAIEQLIEPIVPETMKLYRGEIC